QVGSHRYENLLWGFGANNFQKIIGFFVGFLKLT
ncbi:MAG: hypothetical protein ACI9L9_001225, partial [Marivirga sp.]